MLDLVKLIKSRKRVARDVVAIKQSLLFDNQYYKRTYKLSKYVDAARHFCARGWKLGYDPSEHFDVKYYLSAYEDVRSAGINPLVHYITSGASEKRLPNRHFDVNGFCAAHADYDFNVLNPAEICLSLYGSLNWSANDRDIVSLPEDISKSFEAIFDTDYYLSLNADLLLEKHEAYAHFLKFGQYENRDPAPDFDIFYYKNLIKGQKDLMANPIYHYIKVGRQHDLRTTAPEEIFFDCVEISNPDAVFQLKVCAHAHCFYPELLSELLPGLENLPSSVFIVITVVTEADSCFVRNCIAKERLPHTIEVRVVPNKGRDLGPFLVGCRDLWDRYDLILHIHTKVSPHVKWGQDWRRYLLDQTLGSKGLVNLVIDRFANDPSLGALFPRNYCRIRNFTKREANSSVINSLLRRINISENSGLRGDYAAGSMAWYRTSSLRPLIDMNLGIEHFDEEKGREDLTLAHALERLFPEVVRRSGFQACSYITSRRTQLEPRSGYPSREDSGAPVPNRWLRDTPRIALERPRPVAPTSQAFNAACLDIHWIIPSFGRGAGGHMTIFRIVKLLEQFGHRQTIWIQNAVQFANQSEAKQRIRDWYQPIDERVHVCFLPSDVRRLAGDIVIATDCWTAYPAAQAQNFKERFYLIQDYEPGFHAAGDLQLTAEATYGFGFSNLCAGPWLYDLFTSRGLWARRWDLCADREVYFSSSTSIPQSGKLRIAFYARLYTPRRAVNLGFAAFELLNRRGIKFHVELFGENDIDEQLPFPHTQNGILSPDALGELYRSCDLGVVFSTTNYSLVPLEMMASGLPIVEIDQPSTRAVFQNGEVTFASPTPYEIADAIEALAASPERQKEQRHRGYDFVADLTWKNSARAIEAALIERLEEMSYKPIDPRVVAAPMLITERTATIIIPTYNAGPNFGTLLDRISTQICDFKYDVLIIDSDSTDLTVDIARKFSGRNVRVEQIPKAQFQHGRTRNYGIAQSDGAYIAVITQDALPKNTNWLAALIGGFTQGPRVAGVVGRHEAYTNHDSFTQRDIRQTFDGLALLPNVIDLDIGLPGYIYPGSVMWRMLSHFYSDNNSALARWAWELLPYPEIDWGEDQVWADEALRLGFQKCYVNEAVVYHSHDSSLTTVYERALIEGRFWAEHFGVELHHDLEASIAALDNQDRDYAFQNGIDAKSLAHRLRVNRVLVQGRRAGHRAGSPQLSEN